MMSPWKLHGPKISCSCRTHTQGWEPHRIQPSVWTIAVFICMIRFWSYQVLKALHSTVQQLKCWYNLVVNIGLNTMPLTWHKCNWTTYIAQNLSIQFNRRYLLLMRNKHKTQLRDHRYIEVKVCTYDSLSHPHLRPVRLHTGPNRSSKSLNCFWCHKPLYYKCDFSLSLSVSA